MLLDHLRQTLERKEKRHEQRMNKARRECAGPYQTRDRLRQEVLKLSKEGVLGGEIAIRMNISQSTVSRILKHNYTGEGS